MDTTNQYYATLSVFGVEGE